MINIYNEDCLEAMRRMETDQYNLAIVDPPYGIDRDGHTGVKKHHWKAYKKKDWDNSIPCKDYFIQLKRVSKNQVIWGGNYFVMYLCPSMGWLYWNKGQPGLTMSDGELAYTSFNVALREVIINRCHIKKYGGSIHPTQKPVALYKWILNNYAKEGDKILDTHLGSGSIAIACHDMGFSLDGYELDTEYYEAACKRLKEHQRQLKLF